MLSEGQDVFPTIELRGLYGEETIAAKGEETTKVLEDIIKHLYGAQSELSACLEGIRRGEGRGHKHMARLILAATVLDLPCLAAELKIDWIGALADEDYPFPLWDNLSVLLDLGEGIKLLLDSDVNVDRHGLISGDILGRLTENGFRGRLANCRYLGKFLEAAGKTFTTHYLTGKVRTNGIKDLRLSGRCPRCKSKIIWKEWPHDVHQEEVCPFCKACSTSPCVYALTQLKRLRKIKHRGL